MLYLYGNERCLDGFEIVSLTPLALWCRATEFCKSFFVPACGIYANRVFLRVVEIILETQFVSVYYFARVEKYAFRKVHESSYMKRTRHTFIRVSQ